MAVTFSEQLGSGTASIGQTPQCTRDYLASTTADESPEQVAAEFRAWLLGVQPTLAGFPFQRATVRRNGDLDGGPESWVCTAEYGASRSASWGGEQAAETSKRSFRIGGATATVFNSLETVDSKTPTGGDGPNFKGAINVTDEGVQGVEIFVPEYVESISRVFNAAAVNDAYRATLKNTVGKVNDAAFMGFAAGECLLTEVDGEQRNDLTWQINFRFGIRENQTNIVVGDITVPAKKGWEYLWISYKEAIDAGRKVLVPQAAYVEKVYKTANFNSLNAIAGANWPPLWTP
jgi:hypothetical protein